jgi:hypothetical protein
MLSFFARPRDITPFIATEDVLLAAAKRGADRQVLHERIRRHAQEAGAQVKQHGRPNDLIERLEASGAIDEVHLWSAAPDVSTEMELVKSVGRDLDEQLTFLGCYLAFQLLNLNLRAIDVLPLQLSSQTDRFRV